MEQKTLTYHIEGTFAGLPISLTLSLQADQLVAFMASVYASAIEEAPRLIEQLAEKAAQNDTAIEAALAKAKAMAGRFGCFGQEDMER